MSFTNKVILDVKNTSKDNYRRDLIDRQITAEDFLEAIKYDELCFKDEYGSTQKSQNVINCINTGGYAKIGSKSLDKLIGIDGDDPNDKKHYRADLKIQINESTFKYYLYICKFGHMEFGTFNLYKGIDPEGNNSIILTHQFYYQNCPIVKQERFEMKQSAIDMFNEITFLLNSPKYTPRFINLLADAMTYIPSSLKSVYYFSINKLYQYNSTYMINHYPRPSYVYSYDDILKENYMEIK